SEGASLANKRSPAFELTPVPVAGGSPVQIVAAIAAPAMPLINSRREEGTSDPLFIETPVSAIYFSSLASQLRIASLSRNLMSVAGPDRNFHTRLHREREWQAGDRPVVSPQERHNGQQFQCAAYQMCSLSSRVRSARGAATSLRGVEQYRRRVPHPLRLRSPDLA